MATIHNPDTPFVRHIQGGISDGMEIHVSGIPEYNKKGFLVGLQCGGNIDPRSECAFVFNPRFDDNQIVRNSLQGGFWGHEERGGGFPFHRGQHCEVIIRVMPRHYKVLVNGQHFCNYNHRMQTHRVTHFTVEQGIRVSNIRFVGGDQQCEASCYPEQPVQGAPIYNNPVVPFVHRLGGLYPNKMIFISGIPNSQPSRFTVYLQEGQHFEPNNISFCFDARFNFSNDRNAVIRNAKQGGNWGGEEKHLNYFPFVSNVNFDMIILVESNCFKVAVNNQHLLEFSHRVYELNRVDTLRVDGDLRLTQVRFQ